jgi:UDP-N-acetyl-D-glucosamine dehydrogenase
LKNKVAIIGQGYVGLPLALAVAEAGYTVTGIDNNPLKVAAIANGLSLIEGVESARLLRQIQLERYSIASVFNKVAESEIVIICVPTPLDSKRKPDLSFLLDSISEISNYLQPDTLVILESTVSPGTTRELVLPALLLGSKLNLDELDMVFSPERIDPGNEVWDLVKTPKIVSGITEKAQARAVSFYSKFISTVIECDSIEIAEMAKLLENSFRLVNISFINEISIFCKKIGVDVSKVIEAASTKPYGFMPFYPSLGVGGHCIPVDPVYLLDKSIEMKTPVNMIDISIQVNQNMPKFYVQQAKNILGKLKNKKILILGVAYKADISDHRETPVQDLIVKLREEKAHVSWHDDLVKNWNGETSVSIGTDYDLAILATPHTNLDLSKLGSVPILNTRGSI